VLAGSLGAVGGAALGVAGAAVAHAAAASDASEPPPSEPVASGPAASGSGTHGPTAVPVHGATQAGIARPATPQSFGLLVVGDLDRHDDLSFLPDLGRSIAGLVTTPTPELLPDGAGTLTITVGLGPRAVAARGSGLPGGQPLPAFAHDDGIDPAANGGDMLLAAYADDPTVLRPVVDRLVAQIPAFRPRWQQRGFRGPGHGMIARNPLGFFDGVAVPRTTRELAEDVWLDGALAGASICVVRRLRLDLDAFHTLPVAERERVFGRRLDGAPLSGGAPFDDVNLDAKTADGHYLIPADAHVRAAHPSFTGSRLMLRRSYGFDEGDGDAGLLFVCFQRELRTFVETQRRLDRLDHLMRYATPTASGTFLILPGFTAQRPLGAALP
jgi:dye decolorizing peroxidase